MSISLDTLFNEIYIKYNAELMTSGTFDQEVRWVHELEYDDYANYLHGGEFVFNASMSWKNNDIRKRLVNRLISRNAVGLLLCTPKNAKPDQELIDYCENLRFPLFWLDYEAPFIDILHESYSLLVLDERNENNRAEALRNAILYPDKEELYVNQIDSDSYFAGRNYVILCVGKRDEAYDNEWKQHFEKSFRCAFSKSIITEDSSHIVILLNAYPMTEIVNECTVLLESCPDAVIAIGSNVQSAKDLNKSYENSLVAYSMTSTINYNPICYEKLGVYKLLYGIKADDSAIDFVEDTLGRLIEYDEKNGSDYMKILRAFMDNECNMSQTADALFFHRNTMKYKIAAIKDILGYDIMLNSNRFRIMMSFYIMSLS